MCDNGNIMASTMEGGEIKHIGTNAITKMRRAGALYVIDVRVDKKENEGECFGGQGIRR